MDLTQPIARPEGAISLGEGEGGRRQCVLEVGQGIGRKEGQEGVWAKQARSWERELDASLRRRLGGGGFSGVVRDGGKGKSRWAAMCGMEALEFLLAGPSHSRWWMGTQQQQLLLLLLLLLLPALA